MHANEERGSHVVGAFWALRKSNLYAKNTPPNEAFSNEFTSLINFLP